MTAMVTGMFIFAGYKEAIITKSGDVEETIKATMGGGEIEVAQYISGLAYRAETVATRVYDEMCEQGPGVWEYDVAEELGRWLVEFVEQTEYIPSDMEWEDKVESLTRAFISQTAGE